MVIKERKKRLQAEGASWNDRCRRRSRQNVRGSDRYPIDGWRRGIEREEERARIGRAGGQNESQEQKGCTSHDESSLVQGSGRRVFLLVSGKKAIRLHRVVLASEDVVILLLIQMQDVNDVVGCGSRTGNQEKPRHGRGIRCRGGTKETALDQ
ncbi:MAG: hypothetical protein U0793_19450 [Gemmataceae bacterium]